MHQYFDLVDMLYIPEQVFEQLRASQISSSRRNTGEVEFQLGLCHAVGFGVQRNYDETIRLFSESAAKGFWLARVILRRVATAVGAALDPEVEHLSLEWRNGAGGKVDTEAFRQLLVHIPPRGLASGTSGHHLAESKRNALVPTAPSGEGRLIEAMKLGQVDNIQRLIQKVTDVNFQLDAGETALHYAVVFPDPDNASSILRAGADVLQCTTVDCEISIAGFYRQQVPLNVSPLALAVLLDRVDLLDIFLQRVINDEDQIRNDGTLVDLLAWGAQYQSVGCIEYLCEQLRSESVRPFDSLGLNPLSYAVRADPLFRLLLFTAGTKSTHPEIPPVTVRQLTIVEVLLKAGFPLRADEYTGLNCLHIAAATSDVALLRLLLEYRKTSKPDELEEVSPDGFSPLGIAIIRGNEDAYSALVDAGAKLSRAWPEIHGHALHCCAMYPSAASITIATRILKVHAKAVNTRDKSWRTPLHCAAFRDHNDLIEKLIEAGADIAARDFDGYTPLGAAVSGRSKRAIRYICTAHKRKSQPLISWTFTDPIIEVGWLTYSPLEQLLSPGTISPAREPEMRLEPNRLERFGCCDYPFSEKSIEVLRVLLDCYTHRTRLGINFFEHMFFSMAHYSGIQTAISMGNVEAVKLILKSKEFSHDYRCLVLYAHNQRMVGSSHIADEATREIMLDYLEGCDDKDFNARRQERRTTSWFSLLWNLYYLCYGNLEQKQWKRASLWLRNNRTHDYRPLLVEFSPWVQTRWSLNIVSFCIGWTFMAPMIVHFVLIHQNPPTECPRSRKIYAAICLIMVSMHLAGHVAIFANIRHKANIFLLAPYIFTVLSVLYRRCRAQYHGFDKPLALVQCSFSLFVTAGCCYLCYLLQPEQEMIFPILTLPDFTPKQRSRVETFGSLSQALEGVLIAVPA
jgi:ankyrin repeat protein